MTPLDEGSVRRRALYLYNKQYLQETNIHVPDQIRNQQSQQASCRRATPYTASSRGSTLTENANLKITIIS